MNDHTRQALGRRLGINHKRIILWRLTAGAGGRTANYLGGSREAFPTGLEAEIEVQVLAEPADMLKLAQASARSSSLYVKGACGRIQAGDMRTDVTISLSYGKDTQHIFKAMLQDFTVRGAQKGKR